ncbi:uncharacterized protein LOC125536009 [Triticum urartu]|uniref:uncharacterized protein LOC125536009 n=1 Tax=Triticum urartu TaxID=4572 RepID=UPI002043D924|nr:uncharacterized protein LOC125536009 [Triticum urartu]
MPRVRRMWIWARLSAIGGAVVLRAVDVTDLPRLEVKLGGVRRWRRPGIGRAASIYLVAAARKSPRVQAVGAVTRGREWRMVIRGVANRAGGQGERADLVSSLGIPCWASCWASGWAWRWASGPCWAGAASKVDAVRFGRFLDGLGWPRGIGRWVCRGGLHLLRCLRGPVRDGRGLSSQWQRGSSKASQQRVRRDLQRLGVGDLACQGLAGWVAILIPMRVRVIYAWHDCVVGGPLGAGGDVVLCWRGVGASALRLVAKGASQRAGGDRCQVTRALRTWATSGRARGQSSRRGGSFCTSGLLCHPSFLSTTLSPFGKAAGTVGATSGGPRVHRAAGGLPRRRRRRCNRTGTGAGPASIDDNAIGAATEVGQAPAYGVDGHAIRAAVRGVGGAAALAPASTASAALSAAIGASAASAWCTAPRASISVGGRSRLPGRDSDRDRHRVLEGADGRR